MNLRFGMVLTMLQAANSKDGAEVRDPHDWFKPPEADYEMSPEETLAFVKQQFDPEAVKRKALDKARKEAILR